MTNTEMTESQTNRLEMRWVSVSTADGRTRLEAHWVPVTPARPDLAVVHAA